VASFEISHGFQIWLKVYNIIPIKDRVKLKRFDGLQKKLIDMVHYYNDALSVRACSPMDSRVF
jgi:hypothetical protein